MGLLSKLAGLFKPKPQGAPLAAANRRPSPPPPALDRAALERRLAAGEFGDVAGVLLDRAAPSIALHAVPADEDALALGASKLAGAADLPAQLAWPTHEGRPLELVAQIRLADLAGCEPTGVLPAAGWLWFFYDCLEGWSAEPGTWRVLYSPDPAAPLTRTPWPGPPHPGPAAMRCCALSFVQDWTVPDPEDVALADLELTEEQSSALIDLGFDREAESWLLGYPRLVQGDVRRDHSVRLLLQLGSEDAAEMCWGDLGVLYFTIDAQALAAAEFAAAVCEMQCS